MCGGGSGVVGVESVKTGSGCCNCCGCGRMRQRRRFQTMPLQIGFVMKSFGRRSSTVGTLRRGKSEMMERYLKINAFWRSFSSISEP